MKDFRQRKKKKSYLYRYFTILILFFIFSILLKSVYSSYVKKNGVEQEQQKLDNKYNELLKRKQFLEKNINRLTTEEGVKEEIKKNNNVGENGEIIIRIVK